MRKNLKPLMARKATGGSDDWGTPPDLIRRLASVLGVEGFSLDVAASEYNAKAPAFFTKEDDGLAQSWETEDNGLVYCNPPYSQLSKWIQKAYRESRKGARVVMLIPARTDTQAWHEYAAKAATIIFLKGRVSFLNPDSPEKKQPAPFPSVVLVFDVTQETQKVLHMSLK